MDYLVKLFRQYSPFAFGSLTYCSILLIYCTAVGVCDKVYVVSAKKSGKRLGEGQNNACCERAISSAGPAEVQGYKRALLGDK